METEKILIKGEINLDDLSLIYHSLSGNPIKDLSLATDYAFEIDTVNNIINIEQLNITALDVPLSLSGQITDFKTDKKGGKKPAITLQIKSRMNLASLYQALSFTPWVKQIKVEQGEADLVADLKGDPAKVSTLQYQGELALNQFKAQYTPYPSLSPDIQGKIKFNNQEISIQDLKTKLGKSDLRLQGKVISYRKSPSITLALTSEYLNLDEISGSLTPSSPSSSSSLSKPGIDAPSSQQKGSSDLKWLSLEGTIQVNQTQYKTLTLNDLKMNYSLKDNLFTWQNMTVKTGDQQGTMYADGWLELSNNAYSSQLDLQSFPITELFSMFSLSSPLLSKLGPGFSGQLSTQTRISGQGFSKEKIQQNLNMESEFDLANGKISGIPLGKNISSVLKVAGLPDLQFDHAAGNLKLQNGKIQLNSRLSGRDYILDPNGTIGLDGSLNLNITARLSPKIAQSNSFLRQCLTDDKGWANVPIKAEGTITKPLLTIDAKAIRHQAEKKLKEKAKEKILDKIDRLFKDNQRDPNQDQKKIALTPKDILKDTLKGLFK